MARAARWIRSGRLRDSGRGWGRAEAAAAVSPLQRRWLRCVTGHVGWGWRAGSSLSRHPRSKSATSSSTSEPTGPPPRRRTRRQRDLLRAAEYRLRWRDRPRDVTASWRMRCPSSHRRGSRPLWGRQSPRRRPGAAHSTGIAIVEVGEPCKLDGCKPIPAGVGALANLLRSVTSKSSRVLRAASIFAASVNRADGAPGPRDNAVDAGCPRRRHSRAMSERVTVERDDKVLLIGVNRPEKRNAFESRKPSTSLGAALKRSSRILKSAPASCSGMATTSRLGSIWHRSSRRLPKGAGRARGNYAYDPFGLWARPVPNRSSWR